MSLAEAVSAAMAPDRARFGSAKRTPHGRARYSPGSRHQQNLAPNRTRTQARRRVSVLYASS